MSVAQTDTSKPRWLHRHWKLALTTVIAGFLLVLAVVSWSFSSLVVAPDHSRLATDATVEGLRSGQVVLTRSTDSLRPGVYGLDWRDGHAIVEGVTGSDAHTVTRTMRAVKGNLAVGTKVTLDSSVYEGNPQQALGLRFSNVEVPDELGPMPAWLIPGHSRTWAIAVHGINSDRQDMMRVVPTLHRMGLPTMLITYREDIGAPRSPDGFHHMGLTEWRDLQAAARYALAHGAQHLVVIGYSMGGSIVTQFMERSPLARDVKGMVLDAPALSWTKILSFNAKKMGFPSFGAIPVEWAVGLRIDANWDQLEALDHTASFRLPTLLFHGMEDKTVPISLSDEFAKKLPGWVSYYRAAHAGHVESWNVDPALYERRLTAFLGRIGD
ncbi:MAG TPA: alpha/beta hydrolase [Solirubrobacteraceae bacterium]